MLPPAIHHNSQPTSHNAEGEAMPNHQFTPSCLLLTLQISQSKLVSLPDQELPQCSGRYWQRSWSCGLTAAVVAGLDCCGWSVSISAGLGGFSSTTTTTTTLTPTCAHQRVTADIDLDGLAVHNCVTVVHVCHFLRLPCLTSLRFQGCDWMNLLDCKLIGALQWL